MATIEELARAYWHAEESRDLTAILAFFSDDAEWRGPGRILRGIDEIRTFYAQSVARFPRLSVTVGRVIGSDDEASIEWTATFEDAAGHRHPLDGVNVMRRDGDKIASLVTYNDPSTLVRAPVPATPIAIQDRFKDRRILVTGAGSGIGAATARHFIAEGAFVTGVDIDEDGLDRVARSLSDGRERFTTLRADIADHDAHAAIVAKASDNEGRLDVLVNNAAVFLLAGVEASDQQWRRTVDVNLIAPAQLTAAAAEALARGRAPAVVNIASISGHVSQANRWTYNASKGGVLSLTRCQALDLASRGIRVNSVSPGYIWTEILYRGAGNDRAKWDPIWGSYCPLDRCGEPFEVAQAVAFLASDAAAFITGTDLLVDGGLVSMSPDGRAVYEFAS